MGLIALVLALGAVVFYVGLKSFPTAAGGLGSAVSGFIGNVLAAPTPKPSVVPIADAPTLALPAEPYTLRDDRRSAGDRSESRCVGSPAYRIRVYQSLPGQSPTPLREVQLADQPPPDRHPGRIEQRHQRLLGDARRVGR